jgi:integrase
MPRVKPDYVPSYRKHKATGQGVVTLNGRSIYLGRHGSKESKKEYDRITGEWLANGREMPDKSRDITILELLVAYGKHAETYYRGADGKPTGELACLRSALRPVKLLYGSLPANEFGPVQLRTVRETMIGYGWCRRSINIHLSRIKHMVKWACEQGLLVPEAYHRLLCVSGLRRGRSGARETEPVKPVPDAFVEAARPFMPEPVKAMVDLQLLTGARPGEACLVRGIDIDMTGRVWIYRPQAHKTQHHGHSREIYIGPKAQELLKPWLKLDTQAYLFDPREWEEKRSQVRRMNRKNPLWLSHLREQERKRKEGDGGGSTTTTTWQPTEEQSLVPVARRILEYDFASVVLTINGTDHTLEQEKDQSTTDFSLSQQLRTQLSRAVPRHQFRTLSSDVIDRLASLALSHGNDIVAMELDRLTSIPSYLCRKIAYSLNPNLKKFNEEQRIAFDEALKGLMSECQVLYLPTYRRIEKDLSLILPRLEESMRAVQQERELPAVDADHLRSQKKWVNNCTDCAGT